MDYLLYLHHILHVGLLFIFTSVRSEEEREFSNDTLRPSFLPSVSNITVKAGGLAVLPCSIQNLQDKQVVWRYVDEDKFLTIGKKTWYQSDDLIIEHLSQSSNISNWDLLIKNVKFKHGGVYECQITSTSDLTRRVQLNVLETKVRGDRAIDRGERIYLKCNVTGGPHLPTDVRWFKNGHLITSQEYPKTVITQYTSPANKTLITELIVDRSVFSDTGIYTCKSKSLETVKAKLRLQIGDTVHFRKVPVSEDLKEERSKQFAAVYKSGSLHTDSGSRKISDHISSWCSALVVIVLVYR